MAETVVIMAERIGLNPDATPDQIRDRVHALADEIALKDAKIKALEERTFGLVAKLSEGVKAVERLKDMEAQLFADRAVREQRIDKAEEPILIAMFKMDKPLAEKWVADRGERMYLAMEQGIGGDSDTPDVMAEIDSRVAEKRAKDPSLTAGEAQAKVFAETPALYDRYVEARRKGGGR